MQLRYHVMYQHFSGHMVKLLFVSGVNYLDRLTTIILAGFG